MSTDPKKALKMAVCRHCGSSSFLPPDLPPLTPIPCKKCGKDIIVPIQLRQFELRSPIAGGGMGMVYRAFDLNLHREVAVKLMRREIASDPASREAFAREARVCATLNHTNIIHVYTYDEINGQPYIVMELADRGSLDDWIERDGRVPELDVLDVAIKIGSALDTAAKHRLLHLDIKPGNILYNAEGEPKLVDFGLARNTEADPSAEDGGVMGTPYYIAPERITREYEDSILCDMYSLAATLYHALTGHVPFEADTNEEVAYAHVHVPLTPPNKVVADISEHTSHALVRAMAKNPAERFLSYDEFRMAFEAARSHLLVRKFKVH